MTIDSLFSVGKGYASKVGLLGLLLSALGAAAVQFSQSPCHDLACWLDLAKGVFVAVGGFGIARKFLPVIDKLAST